MRRGMNHLLIYHPCERALLYIKADLPSLSRSVSSLSKLYRLSFVGLAYQGKDIVSRFIIEYSSLRGFGP
jgi:hypothetical protein